MNRRAKLRARVGAPVCVLALALALGACTAQSTGPAIRVEDAWIRPALTGNTTAAYMTIYNDGGAADRLRSVGVESAGRAEIHETVHEGDLVRMVPRTQGLEVPAGAELRLEPGATHVMLIDLGNDMTIGDSVPMTLTFEQSGAIVVNAAVRQDAGAGVGEGGEQGGR